MHLAPPLRSSRILIVLVVFIGLAISGSAEVPVRTIADAAYKPADSTTDYEKERCKLDWYVPEGNGKNLPVLVWFHGGGLTGGDKGHTSTVLVCKALAGEGMIVASANYRLSPAAKYPAYVEDAAAAVAFAQVHAGEHGGDPAKVFVGGHSAGGYLAAIVAMDERLLKKFGSSPGKLAGAIPVAGQMVTHYTIREERGLPRPRIIIDDAAPLHHVRKETPPLLLLYAEKDMALRGEENRYFAAALQAAGNERVAIKEVAGHDHGGIGNRIAEPHSVVRAMLVNFIRENEKH